MNIIPSKVLFRDEAGNTGSRFARQFLPRKAWPTAVVYADGTVSRITSDPLPPRAELAQVLAELQSPDANLLALADLPSGTLVAIDVSGGRNDYELADLQVALRPYLGLVTLVFFDAEVHTVFPGIGGGTSFKAVQAYVEALETHPTKVVVFTDGYAPYISPARPSLWSWVISEGGDTWPSRRSVARMPVFSGYTP